MTACILCGATKRRLAAKLAGGESRDGYVCRDCLHKLQPQFEYLLPGPFSREQLLKQLRKKEHEREICAQDPSARVGKYLAIYKKERKWAHHTATYYGIAPDLYDFADITGYELVNLNCEPKGYAASKKAPRHWLSNLPKFNDLIYRRSIIIYTQLPDQPQIELVLQDEPVREQTIADTWSQKQADRLCHLLERMMQIAREDADHERQAAAGAEEELRQYQALLDAGVLSPAEFAEVQRQFKRE